jgi:predicted CopG family antitoxin
MNMVEITRVPLARTTREALKALKRGGESYDAVIRRLMKEAEGS